MKKINLRRLSTILSEKELKNVLGGSGNWLPEFEIVCGQFEGRCWKEDTFEILGIPHRRCVFTGNPNDFCR